MTFDIPALSVAGLQRFQELQGEAINTVAERFYATHGAVYAQFGQRGRDACREDLAYHLEFLRPALEFGVLQPMVDYLCWLASVLASRDVSVEHVPQALDWLSEFFASHMEGPDAQAVAHTLDQAKLRFREAGDALPAYYEMMPAPWPESEAFESALLAGDRRGAEALLELCLNQGHTLVEAEVHVIQPALYGIGRRWQRNQVTVAQEHLATAISQSLMSHALLNSELPASNGKKVLLACVEHNSHSVGLQMVADAFQLAGWDVQHLGANVPTRALIQHVDTFKPDLLGLSASIPQQLRSVKDIIAQLTRLYGPGRARVIIGGLAINQFNRLARTLGGDSWSPDATSAVISAARLPMQPAPA